MPAAMKGRRHTLDFLFDIPFVLLGGKRRRQRAPRIELYPKDCLPPSIGSLRRGKAARASDAIAAEAE